MVEYRILTEHCGELARYAAIVSAYFDSFSLSSSVGYWKGKQENSLCISIITSRSSWPAIKVQAIAKKIKAEFGQEAVYIVKSKVGLDVI